MMVAEYRTSANNRKVGGAGDHKQEKAQQYIHQPSWGADSSEKKHQVPGAPATCEVKFYSTRGNLSN